MEVARVVNAPPPESLRAAGIAEWNHALAVCKWIAGSDLMALRFLCEAVDRREALSAKMNEENAELMLETSTGYAYANPVLAALEKTEERISKWMTQLGMTPSARGALGVAEVKTASTLDELAAKRRARAGGEPPPEKDDLTTLTDGRSTPAGSTKARRRVASISRTP